MALRICWLALNSFSRALHVGQSCTIKPGQLIHVSVAFNKYIPRAKFSAEMQGRSWGTIIGQGHKDDINWANNLADILEMDLFDHSQAGLLIGQLKDFSSWYIYTFELMAPG
jgi:hypothetical protein